MSSRHNFLDADNSIMERNLRFVQNDLEDNLNQYFGGSGSRGNNPAISAPPRDYKVVQPKAGNSLGYKRQPDLDERREFLNQIGLARYEAYDLAKAVIFDVQYYRKKRIEWLAQMREPTQVKQRIVDELQSSDYKYHGYISDIRGTEKGYGLITNLQSERHVLDNSCFRLDDDNEPPKAPRKIEWNIDSPSRSQSPAKHLNYMEIREYNTRGETHNQRISSHSLPKKINRMDNRHYSHDYLRRSRSPEHKETSALRSSAKYSSHMDNTIESRKQRKISRSPLRNKYSFGYFPDKRNYFTPRSRSPKSNYRTEIYQSSRLRSPSTGIKINTSDRSKAAPRKKSLSRVWASRCSTARHILAKIANNALNGIVDDRDEVFRIKYQAVLDEYVKYKESVAREKQVKDTELRSKSPNSHHTAIKRNIKNVQKSPSSLTSNTNDNKTELLVSSQKPLINPSEEIVIMLSSTEEVKTEDQPQRTRKLKSPGELWRSRYSKAVFILDKIAENALNGVVHERDEEDRIKYQNQVEEYHKFSEAARKVDGSKRNRYQKGSYRPPNRKNL